MRLRDFLQPTAISLALEASNKDAVLDRLVELLRLDAESSAELARALRRRESMGSTGVGRGIAIPHARSIVVTELQLAFGRHRAGVDFQAMDGEPAHYFFLIVAPTIEISNQYLPVLGRIAQFAKDADVPDRLAALSEPAELLRMFDEKRV